MSILGTTSIGVPSKGEILDEDIIAAARLKIVYGPHASSSRTKEEQLLQAMNNNFQ